MYKITFFGKDYKSNHFVASDHVCCLSYRFVTNSIITPEEWAKSQETILDRFQLTMTTQRVDGRKKEIRDLPWFNWGLLLTDAIRPKLSPASVLARKVIVMTKLFNGCTYNIKMETPSSGYMVSWRPSNVNHPLVFDSVKAMDEAMIYGYIACMTMLWPKLYIGSWVDSETGKVHLDVSENIYELDAALTLARQNDQIAIWDVINNQEIRLK